MFGRDLGRLPGMVAALGIALSAVLFVATDRWQVAGAWQLAEADADAMAASLGQEVGLRIARLNLIQALVTVTATPLPHAEFRALAGQVLPGETVSLVDRSGSVLAQEGNALRHPAMPRAMDHAVVTGAVAASPPVRLAHLAPPATAVLLYAPVFPGGPVPASAERRSRDLRGFVVSSLGLDAVMAEAVRAGGHLRGPLRVLDVTEGADVELYRTGWGAAAGSDHVVREVEVGGRHWRVVRQVVLGWRDRLPAWGGLALGLAMTGLCTALAVGASRCRRDAVVSTARLAHALAEAERARIAKIHVLDSASHDLRQPLQALRLFVDYLVPRLAGSDNEPIVRKVDQALGNTQALIEEVLEVSRLEKGAVVPITRYLDLAPLLAEVVEEFRVLADHKGLVLRARLPATWASTDAALLRRLVRNLVANALRFTERGGVLVGLRRRGCRPVIEVWDTGIGIPDEQLPLIWEDLYQIGNQARQRDHGLGLGLGVARRLAAALQAELDVASSPKRGSVFRVVLPEVLDA